MDEQDAHDATPLYLAALTGRSEICKFLLQSGAKCDPDSGGDAARVFYVALTPQLRKLLREWSLSAASRDPFLDMLRKTYNDRKHADTVVVLNDGKSIYLHRLLLKARCPRLASLIVDVSNNDEHDGLDELRLPEEHRVPVMADLLFYLYTGEIETRDVETALIALQMAKEYELQTLYQRLESSLERYIKGNNNSKSRGEDLYRDIKGFRCDMSDLSLVRQDMAQLAALVSTPHNDIENIDILNHLVEESDTTVKCEDRTWSLHAFMLCGQSEYFKCALEGGFREAQESFVDLTHLLPCSEAFQLGIQWLYSDRFLEDEVPLEVAVWLLELGSAILCPRLMAYTTNVALIPGVDEDNVFDMLELSKIHGLEKLEDRCVEVIAYNLRSLAKRPELRDVIIEEASQIIQGGDIQVTDVPIAAEMKSAINKHEGLSHTERVEMLQLIQQVVEDSLSKALK
jgi:ankyrin repeat/BTB/POZ domain-containing protein 1